MSEAFHVTLRTDCRRNIPNLPVFPPKLMGATSTETAALRTMSLSLAELDAVYGTVSHEEAVAIANLGAECYLAAKERLYTSWAAAQDDTEQEEIWRKEGAASMLESLKARLAAGDAAVARVAALQSGVEAELERRVEEVLSVRLKEVELAKREEMLELKGQMAELQSSAKMFAMLEETHSALKGELAQLREENGALKEATAVKSSHALGKMGEATVFEMLDKYVSPKFSYAEVMNVSKQRHVGDIHMVLMLPTGKQMKIMVDVKNYTAAVNTKEIDKLYSDLDEHDSDVGLMVSLDSAICKRAPFQIMKTPKGKSCMFLSFEGIDDSLRQEILCWAVRVLVGIVATYDNSSQEVMITEIKQFLAELSGSLDLLESNVKMAKGLYESLRDTKSQLVGRVQAYRLTCGLEIITPVIYNSHEHDSKYERCRGKTMKGEQCKIKKHLVGGYCKQHRIIQTNVECSSTESTGETITLID